jgi:hypothetical protein
MGKMNKPKRMNWSGGVLILLMVGIPGMVRADLQEILLKFQPYLSVQEEYSSNIDLTPNNKKDDFITTVSPGLRFSSLGRSPTTGELRQAPKAEEEKYGIDLDYRLGLVFYSKKTENNFVSHQGNLNSWYTFDRRLTLRLSEYLIRSEEPREQEYPGASPTHISGSFGNLIDLYLLGTQRRRSVYVRNVVSPSVEYKLSKDSLISLNYSNNIYRPDDPASEKSQEDFINPKLTYWFNIRNGISLEYGLMLDNFERSPDLTGHLARGRYTYRFNPRTSVFGEYTYLRRDFKDPGIDYDVHVPTLGIEHLFSPTLSVSAQLGYFWELPEKGSNQNDPYYNVVVTQRQQKIVYSLLFQGGYREDYITSENRGFTHYHRAVGAVTYQLAEKITTGLSGSYEYAKSALKQSGPLLPANQRDNIWGLNGNLGYQLLKWLNLSMTLSYRDDHSNISTQDYNEFRGMFKAEAIYK